MKIQGKLYALMQRREKLHDQCISLINSIAGVLESKGFKKPTSPESESKGWGVYIAYNDGFDIETMVYPANRSLFGMPIKTTHIDTMDGIFLFYLFDTEAEAQKAEAKIKKILGVQRD